MSKLTIDNFGQYFINEAFDMIYSATSKEFQEMLSGIDFQTICREFKQGVQIFEKFSEKQLLGLTSVVWINEEKERAIQVAYDQNQVIVALYFKPFITCASDEQWTKNQYQMPINEEWFVFWGGTNVIDNYHYAYAQQRYAYDLVQVRNGATFTGDPLINESYYAFGTDVVAPLNGTVVTVVDGCIDNVPGEMDEQDPAGNYVIIEHTNNEYSMMAHLKNGSIQVREGEVVNVGQVLGQCGNSGNSSEAHIHFQVMDHQQMEQGKSIRIQFQDGSNPVQGDVVGLSE